MYSSIEEEDRIDVIQKCYWPLFKLADAGIPFGFEAPALTLELIDDIDKEWVKTLSTYIKYGKIEFIGSGYSQIIGPLVPAKVNNWNQKLGLEIYKKLLGIKPKVALVNEMAYSSGVVEHYANSGYEAIIVEWNNPRKYHEKWHNEWRYYPQKAVVTDGHSIPLIWADSIAFQKFQRYTHGENELNEYVNYIKSHSSTNDHFFPLYSNDAEIFDFRPGRYCTESDIKNYSDWDRIIGLYNYLETQKWCDIVFPSEVLEGISHINGGHKLKLESPAQPIPVKKQEKYNINRWALTGRNDLGINTKCYQVYKAFLDADNENAADWKELCYLWSSDFRTHITENRWGNYQKRLNKFINKLYSKDRNDKWKNIKSNGSGLKIVENDRYVNIEGDVLKLVLNKNKGLTIKEYFIRSISKKYLLGTLDHGYYDDITLGADYYSGHAIIEIPGEHKITDLDKVEPEIIQNDSHFILTNEQNRRDYTFYNKIFINSKTLTIEKRITIKTDKKSIIHPFNITFNPQAWDRESLYIATHNGGKSLENFYLKGQHIFHGDIYSSLISARHGFGNTDGLLIVGDKNKKLTFGCDMSIAALIPSIIYKEMDGTYFFRLQYSAREMDETLKLCTGQIIIQSFIKIIAN